MSRIKVLIVDDSVVVRRILSDAIAATDDLEVAGIAANGHIGLAKLSRVQPDVVVLDVEMPEINGLETLAALRKTHPALPVIMFSSLTHLGAAATLDALALGANDYAMKPTAANGRPSVEQIGEQLLPKIRALTGRASLALPDRHPVVVPRTPPPRPAGPAPVRIVALGSSTGGPNALAELIPALPERFPVPVVAVQHMPPVFTRLLAERLGSRSRLRVKEAEQGELLRPGTVYFAPGDWHLEVHSERGEDRAVLHQGPQENSCRPAVDVLFRSLASAHGAGVLATVLTGMGKDGLAGAELLRERGAQILAQDEATSVVWGMPGYIAKAKLADRVLPIGELAGEILRRVEHGVLCRAAGSAALQGGPR